MHICMHYIVIYYILCYDVKLCVYKIQYTGKLYRKFIPRGPHHSTSVCFGSSSRSSSEPSFISVEGIPEKRWFTNLLHYTIFSSYTSVVKGVASLESHDAIKVALFSKPFQGPTWSRACLAGHHSKRLWKESQFHQFLCQPKFPL